MLPSEDWSTFSALRPHSGITDPGLTVTASVMLQPFDYDPNEKNKHKFMVQTTFAPANISDVEAVWKEANLMSYWILNWDVFEMPNENGKWNDMGPGKKLFLWMHLNQMDSHQNHKVSLSDTETGKLMEECKRPQGEMVKLSEENQHLRGRLTAQKGGSLG